MRTTILTLIASAMTMLLAPPASASWTHHPLPGWARHHHTDCTRYERICLTNLREGARWQWLGRYDGHSPCLILIGDTSLIACRGGYITTS